MKIVHAIVTGIYAIGYVANGLWFLWLSLEETYREGFWSLLDPWFDLQLTFIWLLSWQTWVLLACTFICYTLVTKTQQAPSDRQ